jgi:DNA-binding CsgD family transcriptional regulator
MGQSDKHKGKDNDATAIDPLLRQAMELGLLDDELLAEARQIKRLNEAVGNLDDSLYKQLHDRVSAETNRKPSRLAAFSQEYRLTESESALLLSLCEGLSSAAHATKMNISKHTARTHMQRLREKTGASRQADLVRMALEWQPGL